MFRLSLGNDDDEAVVLSVQQIVSPQLGTTLAFEKLAALLGDLRPHAGGRTAGGGQERCVRTNCALARQARAWLCSRCPRPLDHAALRAKLQLQMSPVYS